MDDKEPFSTRISSVIKRKFQAKCKADGYKGNEALEALMSGYAEGIIVIKKTLTCEIIESGNKEKE